MQIPVPLRNVNTLHLGWGPSPLPHSPHTWSTYSMISRRKQIFAILLSEEMSRTDPRSAERIDTQLYLPICTETHDMVIGRQTEAPPRGRESYSFRQNFYGVRWMEPNEALGIGRKSLTVFCFVFPFNWLWYCLKNTTEDAIFLKVWKENSMERIREEISRQYLRSETSSSPGCFVSCHTWAASRMVAWGAPCYHVYLSSLFPWWPWMKRKVHTNIVQVVSIWFREKKSQSPFLQDYF